MRPAALFTALIGLSILIPATPGPGQEAGEAAEGAKPLHAAPLDLQRLKRWGKRAYRYILDKGGQRREIGDVRLETTVEEGQVVFRDVWRIEDRGKRLRWGMKAACDKAGLMRPRSIVASGSDADELATYRMQVRGKRAVVQDDRRERSVMALPEGVVTDAALWRVVTLLPRQRGRRWRFDHLLELSERNLKAGGEIVCEGRVTVELGDGPADLWRFTQRRDHHIVAEFWVDGETDALGMFRLDGRKLFIETDAEDAR